MSDESFSSLMTHASILMQHFQWPDALEVISRAVILARRQSEVDDRPLATALEKLAVVCKELGKDLDAERALHESTTIHLKHVRNSGVALADLQKYAAAEQEYREALRICELAFGPDHGETATCLDNLATCLRVQSRFVEAAPLCDRARVIRERVYGENHGHTAMSYSNLGQLCRILGQHDQAEQYLLKSLVIRERIYGPDHLHVAESLDRLASLHRDRGRFDEAIPLGERCVRIRREHLGSDHALTGAAIHNLALSRERRPGELFPAGPVAPPKPEAPQAAPLPAETPVAAAVSLPAADRTPGYLIAVILAVGALIVSATFSFVPLVGGIVVVTAWLIYILVMNNAVPLESFLKKLSFGLGRLLDGSRGGDDGSFALGPATSTGHIPLGAVELKGLFTAKDACKLIQLGSDTLDLPLVHALTQSAADELVKHRGTLRLNGLSEVRSWLAKILRCHEGRLELNGVRDLGEAAAAHLARHAGDLCLCGLRTLPKDVARQLAHHTGTLELNGIHVLSEDAASSLIRHKGAIELQECRATSDETKRILRSNPLIYFPDREMIEI